jgi:hypothetical protein
LSLREFNTQGVDYLLLSADKLHTRRCLAQRCLKCSVFSDFNISSVILKEAFSDDAPGLKLNCSVAKM